MKIAVWHNLPSGGAKRVLQYQLRGLAARGHQIEIWRPPVPDNDFASFSGIAEEHEVPLETLPETGHHFNDLVRHARRGAFSVSAMRAHSERVAREMTAGEWDIVFSNTCREFGSPFLGRYLKAPKLLYLQEPHRAYYEALPRLPWIDLPEEVQRSWSPRGLKTRMRDRIDLRAARLHGREELANASAQDQILVNSLFSRESVLRAYGLDSRVCYLGVDTGLFQDLTLPRERFIVGLGTLGPTKNVELAIRALGAMASPRPPLVWIGNMCDAPYLERMKVLAHELDVDFRSELMATDSDLVNALNRASAMIYTPRLEPFGLSPLEANACACPVVAVAEGGVRETIEHGRNGLLAGSDPSELAEQLSKILEDPQMGRQMGQAAKEWVQTKWNVHSAVDRIEQELKRVAR